MDAKQQKALLKLARLSLESRFYDSEPETDQLFHKDFEQQRGIFVSLHEQNGDLRGCIGHLEATGSIWDQVIELVQAAAFEDPRFPDLKSVELRGIGIEISVLTQPIEVLGTTSRTKINQLKPGLDGVILEAQGKRATYLPQVWESFTKADDFVASLCHKAGLAKNYWQNHSLDLWTYRVECFKEA